MAILQEIRDPVILVLLMVFLIATLLQLFYLWGLNGRLGFSRRKTGRKDVVHPVSVIICVKDEYYQLKENLPFVLHQDHPVFEVVVVDDASVDETRFLLEDLGKEYTNLSPVFINSDLNFFRGKKFPLSIGIRSAKYDHILLLDADCRPASRNWLKMMQSHFSDETKIVLGYSAYMRRSSFFNTLIRYDAVNTAMHYLGWAKARIPYKGIGRNLGYHRDLFWEQGGFISHYNLPAGEDDLFVNRVARGRNTAIETDSDAFTIARSPGSWRSWVRQKRRALMTEAHYRSRDKALLGAEWLSGLLHYGTFVALLWLNIALIPVLVTFGIRLISLLIVFKKSMIKLQEKDLLVFSPLMEVFFLLFNPALAVSNRFLRKPKWK